MEIYPVTEDLFFNQLCLLKPEMAKAAQAIYDEWPVDDGHGICDIISEEFGNIVVKNFAEADVDEGGQEGDDHSWVVVYANGKSYGVDIPCYIYERGGGYHWDKIHGVSIKPKHICIWELE